MYLNDRMITSLIKLYQNLYFRKILDYKFYISSRFNLFNIFNTV